MSKADRILKTILCLALVVAFASCAGGPKKESTGQYIDDSAITTKVKTAIFNEPTLKTMNISVETYKGVVQLSGFVNRQENISKAAEVARTVPGVREVKNNLQVKTQ